MRAFSTVLVVGLISLLAAGLLFSCNKQHCSPPYVEKYQEVPDFRSVDVDLNAKITYGYGAIAGVRLHGDSGTLAMIDYHVTGGTLVLRYKKPAAAPLKPVTVILTSPELESVAVAGTGSLVVPVLHTPELKVRMKGSSNVVLGSLEAEMLDVSVLGSGNFIMESGTVQQQEVSVSGSGYADMSNCSIAAAVVRIYGSGNVYSKVQADVQLEHSGSGRLIRK